MEIVILTVVIFALAGLGVGIWWFSSHEVAKRRVRASTSVSNAAGWS